MDSDEEMDRINRTPVKTNFTRFGKVLVYGGLSLTLGGGGGLLYGENMYLSGYDMEILAPYEKVQRDLSQLKKEKGNLEMKLFIPFDLGAPGGGVIRDAYSEDIKKLKAVEYAMRETELELERLEKVPDITEEIENRKKSHNKWTFYSVLTMISGCIVACGSVSGGLMEKEGDED